MLQNINDSMGILSEWVKFPPDTVYGKSFWGRPFQALHSNETESITFTEKPDTEHKTQKRRKSKMVRTVHNKRAYVTVMAVLIIFRLILQIVINLRTLSID